MRVLLIYPDITYEEYRSADQWTGKFYSGVAYLSAALKKAGHDCRLYHVTQDVPDDRFLERVAALGPFDLVGFSFTTQMYRFVCRYSRLLRETYPKILQICGGVFTTLNPRRVLDELPVDFACRGDGELPIVSLCDALTQGLSLDEVPNIWFKRDGAVVEKPFSKLDLDLDDVPFPDRSLFDFPNLEYESKGITTLMAGRGCPYGCAYCSNNFLKRLYQAGKNFIRYRSPENVIAEAIHIRDTYPFIKELFFSDDILPLNMPWFKKFSSLYSEQVGMPYSCAIYPRLINAEVLGLLKQSGCKVLNVGIESGNEEIRKNVLRRNLSDAQMKAAMDLCNEFDVSLLTFNMFGLPGETLQNMMETVDLNAYAFRNSEKILAAASIFYPYQQTELGDYCDSMGLIESRENSLNSHFQDSILNVGENQRQTILSVQRNFLDLVRESIKSGPLAPRGEEAILALLAELDAARRQPKQSAA